MSDYIDAWHFRSAAGCTPYLTSPEEVGRTYSASGMIKCCANGLHGSIRAIDALRYAYSTSAVVCRTRHSGAIDFLGDKIASEHRVVIWQADCTKTLHEFACWCTEHAFESIKACGLTPDPRSIAAARATSTGDAAGDAARAAWDATWDVARAAARAAQDAAGDATWDVARAAARAAQDAQNAELERLLALLAPKGG